MQTAQPALGFIAPQYSPIVTHFVHWAIPFWMRQTTDVQQVEAQNLATLVQAYEQFEAGKIRLILAFRHPSINDPIAIGYLLSQLMPRAAKAAGVRLRQPVHAHFMYDRGVPLWTGEIMGWLFSRLGGTSILRGKLDRAGLNSARNLLLNGTFPFIAAPEGGTNGHNEVVAPLEPGMAQLAFWCLEDLAKAQRQEQVVIIPIGLQYQYLDNAWPQIETLLTELETKAGISSPDQGQIEQTSMYKRLYQLGEQLLSIMETHYSRFYHQPIAPVDSALPLDQQFGQRLQQLLNAALSVSESYFKVQPKGSRVDRCRRLEQAAWDNIYRNDVDLDHLSAIERSLADRVATESEMHLWHIRLVERFVSVTGTYVREKPTIERFAETLLITWETIARLAGENSSLKRPRIGAQTAEVVIGTPMLINDRWPQYQENRRQAKQAVETLTQDLQTALEAMID
jgi:hypothetical protein